MSEHEMGCSSGVGQRCTCESIRKGAGGVKACCTALIHRYKELSAKSSERVYGDTALYCKVCHARVIVYVPGSIVVDCS